MDTFKIKLCQDQAELLELMRGQSDELDSAILESKISTSFFASTYSPFDKKTHSNSFKTPSIEIW